MQTTQRTMEPAAFVGIHFNGDLWQHEDQLEDHEKDDWMTLTSEEW